jgi:hypothetical protein
MKLPNTAQTSRPWRIHEIVPDFRLEDVWALPTPGGPDDFPLADEFAAAIAPFRHRLVYPVMLREIGRAWRADGGAPSPADV